MFGNHQIMTLLIILPLMGLLASGICDLLHTHTFQQVGWVRSNLSIERTTTTHYSLRTRAGGNDEDKERWDKAVCKGAQLLAAMAGDEKRAGKLFKPPRESGESDFQDYNDLEKWGYGDAAWDDYYDLDVSLPIKRALAGVGVDTRTLSEEGSNRCMQLEHENEVTIDGTTYKPTTAYFTTVFNPTDGVIIAWGSYGAKHQGSKQDPPITVLPTLQNWSDIAWLQSAQIAGDLAKNLRFVFRSPVANTEAQWLITRALQQSGKQLSTWPGVEFSMDTDEGKAILASPNGSGVAYLLLTHKRQLGRKTIGKVTVFADDGKKQPRPPSLIYHVVDVPPEEPEDEKDGVVERARL